MSSYMESVRSAIAATTEKLRGEVEASHKAGKIPADYSLGWTNAFIFCDHHINRRGVGQQPKFFDRTTSIGQLPKPMVLKPGAFKDVQGADEIYESLRDKVILDARKFVNAQNQDSAYTSRLSLSASISQMDNFVESQMEEPKKEESHEPECP